MGDREALDSLAKLVLEPRAHLADRVYPQRGERDAKVAIMLYFADREPVGPPRLTVSARRTLHPRFNDLQHPEPVPRATDYASVFESGEPIVVQHTRLDSRRARVSLLSTNGLRGGLKAGRSRPVPPKGTKRGYPPFTRTG